MTILTDESDSGQPGEPSQSGYITAWEWVKWLYSAPVPARKNSISIMAHTLRSLWRDGYDLTDFPPVLWRFTPDVPHPLPIIPYLYLKKSVHPHSIDEMIRILADWYAYGRKHVRKHELICFLKHFLDQEPVTRDRFVYLIHEIEVCAKRLTKHAHNPNRPASPLHAQGH